MDPQGILVKRYQQYTLGPGCFQLIEAKSSVESRNAILGYVNMFITVLRPSTEGCL